MFNMFRQQSMDIFIEVYRAYPSSFLGRSDLNLTNSIILPPSALHKLDMMNKGRDSTSPWMFRIMNIELNCHTHCGVLDFTAEEETCYLPENLFNRLYLSEGMFVNVRNINLEKGKFIKIRPHLTDFIKCPNPRTILENNLRSYVCLTKGDTISVFFNKKNYLIDIVECKPKDAICVINCDVEVDFDKPLDYKEEEVIKKSESGELSRGNSLVVSEEVIKEKIQDEKFKGNCFRLDGKNISVQQMKNIEEIQKKKEKEDTYDPRKNRLPGGIKNNNIAFKGDGKALNEKKK